MFLRLYAVLIKGEALNFLPLLIFSMLVFVKPAFAYLDPASSTLIPQVLIAALVGGWFALKNYWQKIVGIFRGTPKPKPSADPEPSGKSNNNL